MDAPRTVPSLSISEAETFFATGEDAFRPSARLNPTTSAQDFARLYSEPGPGTFVGIDVPGVGHVQTTDKGSRIVGAVPEPLRKTIETEDRRERLLISLIFAARDLASHAIQRIQLPMGIGAASPWIYRCQTCHGTGCYVATVRHHKRCRSGRVLKTLDELGRLGAGKFVASDLLPKPPGSDRVCPACHARDNAWITEDLSAETVDLGSLGPNQSASVEIVDGKRTVCTHLCAASSNAADQGGAA